MYLHSLYVNYAECRNWMFSRKQLTFGRFITHPQTFCWNIKLFCQRVIAHREVGSIRAANSKDTLVLSMMSPVFKGTVYQKENFVIIHSPSWDSTSACWPVGFAMAPCPSAPPWSVVVLTVPQTSGLLLQWAPHSLCLSPPAPWLHLGCLLLWLCPVV